MEYVYIEKSFNKPLGELHVKPKLGLFCMLESQN